ncbi:hypothetical protein B296_00058074 [Ensete ventricosum]|uniref:Uncharacterized protein n=1 Tax=Ensete ventricosum TaxID=4639 RepID=A0A426WW73_ENSVE|nr:hypothetical protein B296_00058074 [Ensete ventricosum]
MDVLGHYTKVPRWIILFSKGCPSPLLAALCVTAAAALAQAVAPYGLVAGDRPPYRRTALQPAPLRASHYGRLSPLWAGRNSPCPQVPPRRAVAPMGAPSGLAFAATWPLLVGPAWGLVVVGHPSSSLPSL